MSDCNPNINHAVVAIGYVTGADNYYIVRNSWGTNWGEAGHVKLIMGKNICSMLNYGFTLNL